MGCDLLMCITELDISPVRTDKSSTHGIQFGLDCVFGLSGPDGVGGSVAMVILDVVLDGASKSSKSMAVSVPFIMADAFELEC